MKLVLPAEADIEAVELVREPLYVYAPPLEVSGDIDLLACAGEPTPAVPAPAAPEKPASTPGVTPRFRQIRERTAALYQHRNQPPPPPPTFTFLSSAPNCVIEPTIMASSPRMRPICASMCEMTA